MNVAEINTLHRALTTRWHEEAISLSQVGLLELVEQNHRENFDLWHEEDVARCDDLGAERIRLAKRNIDRHNQQRNDLIETMDRHLVKELQPLDQGCPFNSETPSMMIDRLSILALKEYHMREEAERENASAGHRAACVSKLTVIQQQIDDLAVALAQLFDEVQAGTRSFRVYFQFKMYNDEQLNPQLRRSA